MAALWNTCILIFASTSVSQGSMCYYTTSYYDQFERSQVYKTTHKYCTKDCCSSSNQVACCTKTNSEEEGTNNGGTTAEPGGFLAFGAVFGILIGVTFGLSVCVLVGCYIKKVCFRPIAKLEPKRGKPQNHRAAKYLATLNKGKEKINPKQKVPPPRRKKPSRSQNEATNFAFDEDEYVEALDYRANPTTDYFYDDISDGPSPSPILYNDFEKGGMRIIVSPSCIDFHNLDDNDEVMCEREGHVHPMSQRSVSIDCGQVDHTVNRKESGISADVGMRHARRRLHREPRARGKHRLDRARGRYRLDREEIELTEVCIHSPHDKSL